MTRNLKFALTLVAFSGVVTVGTGFHINVPHCVPKSRHCDKQHVRCSAIPPEGPVVLSKKLPRTSFQVELRRPMGMILEERDNPRRVFVAELAETGSAGDSLGKVLLGDTVERIGTQDCSQETSLEKVMDLIASWPQGEPVPMMLSRDSSIAAVSFDGRRAVAGRIGEVLGQIAKRANARVPYSCENGVCGVCEFSTPGGKQHLRVCTRPLNEPLVESSMPPILLLTKSTRPSNPKGPVRYA